MDSQATFDRKCSFCLILMGESEASLVYQDDLVTAFMDLFPVSPGHILVVPNQHAALITEVDQEAVGGIFTVGAMIDRALSQSGLRCTAVSLYLADGAAAGQAVPHAHLHVVPRFPGETCGLHLHAGPVARVSREELNVHAEKIRSGIPEGPA